MAQQEHRLGHIWMAITPCVDIASADAIAKTEQWGLQVAVFRLPVYGNFSLQPTLKPQDAFQEVDDGGDIYFVGVPFGDCDGGWVSDDWQVCKERSVIVADSVIANILGKAYNQKTILRVSEQRGKDGYLYLLKDTAANRGIALSVAGGYTAGDGYLLVASEELLPSEAIQGEWEYIPVGISLINL